MTEHWLAYLQITQLLVLAPHHFGGVLVRSRSGPVRDRWLVALEQMAKQNGLSVPLRKIPNAITDENLLG
ncbi:MAG: magnesium chelatase ATPase subunit D, partial [Burkholderiaceae bacterium]|nr:magnesium chelatase ATPase subunit D [Burkholderiaceae bacterium]